MADRRGGAEFWRSLCTATFAVRRATSILDLTLLKIFASRFKGSGSSQRHKKAEESHDLLYQAQKMEALGRLTGGVAHDFNNLLTVVLGNATALRVSAELRGDPQAIRRAEMIERAAERGGRVASQLLAFSGKQVLRPETVSVYRIVSNMIGLLAQAAGETVRIRLVSEPGLWNCRIDPGQFESAILNLVLNARDAMPVGGNITINCQNDKVKGREPDKPARLPGDYVRIDIVDTGTGIPPELHEKVFEPFFTTKPVGKGSGLGLAQVYGFAGQSEGWVELDSALGRGTTVMLFLPRDKGKPSESAPRNDGPAQVGHNEIVLVVEPDADLRATTCETLSRAGYQPRSAASGSGAFAQLVSEDPINLLLIETNLPGGLSGYDLERSACQVRPGLRVLATSSALGDAPMPRVDTKRGFEFLPKPYTPSDLVSVVAAVLASNTFSPETEELFAEARAHGHAAEEPAPASRPVVAGCTTAGAALPAAKSNAIRLGVMPFKFIGAGGDDSVSLGLAEEITKAFSRFRAIVCAAPASVAALAEEPIGETERWRQLNLHYLIQGRLRRKGEEIHVVVRLINMHGAGEISWGQRFDAPMQDVLSLQDRIALETAAQIAPEMLVWEAQEAALRPRVDPTAYDLMLRAIPATYRLDEAAFREAGTLLEESVALDPGNAGSHSWLAQWYLLSVGQGWTTDPAAATARADYLSQQAVALDADDARGFTVAGHIRAFLHNDLEAALWLHERAIALNPSLALAWCYCGLAHSYLGQHTEAIRRIQHAQQLSPHDPHRFFFDASLAVPYLLTGEYEAAARACRRARHLNPALSSTYKVLLAALGHLGASREAAAVRKALFSLEPGFSVTDALRRSPVRRQEDRRCYAEGLRLAGIPA